MPVLTETQPSQWSRKSAINSLILLATCPCSGLHNPAGGDSLQARPNQSTSQPTKRLVPRMMRPGNCWCGHRLGRFKLLFVLCTHLYAYGYACTHACHVHVCSFKQTAYYSFWVCVLRAYCMCTCVFCVGLSPLFEACFASTGAHQLECTPQSAGHKVCHLAVCAPRCDCPQVWDETCSFNDIVCVHLFKIIQISSFNNASLMIINKCLHIICIEIQFDCICISENRGTPSCGWCIENDNLRGQHIPPTLPFLHARKLPMEHILLIILIAGHHDKNI